MQGSIAAAVDVEEILTCKKLFSLLTDWNKQTDGFPNDECFAQLTGEEQGEDDDELVHGVAQDVLHHGPGYEGLVAAVRFT